MAWSSLSSRLSTLPLLLAGPIVRRAETSKVSIWFALKQNHVAIVNVYASKEDENPIMTGIHGAGIEIGDHLFIYCITATGDNLEYGTNYYYDIEIENNSLSEIIDAGLDLTYDGGNRPSFALPPTDINNVKILHGSCRKPHGEGYDALEGVNTNLEAAVNNNLIDANKRPHQLFLTGDQIYADDVADILLFMIDDAAKVLFNWDEDYSPFTDDELKPGKRNTNNRLRNDVGLSGMIPKSNYSKSHLLKFREYSCMYLFVWSEVLWPSNTNLPSYSDVYSEEGHEDVFNEEKSHIIRFKTTLKEVRKGLANIPTYMIFDDHEITDDWNLNWRWCKEVYSKSLGRRTIQNGLLAFAIFQAWGNTPNQFELEKGVNLLGSASLWRGEEDDNFSEISTLLNVPTIALDASIQDFSHSALAFDWHFSYENATNYSVYVQDSRTWRHFPHPSSNPKKNNIEFVGLISKEGFAAQLPETFPQKEIYLIISPSPVIGIPFTEDQQRHKMSWEDRCDIDTEAWTLNEEAFERLFSSLILRLPVINDNGENKREGRFAFLSGDVHSGSSGRHQVWGTQFIRPPFDNDNNPINTNAVFGQLTASALKNYTHNGCCRFKTTERLHDIGYPHSILGEFAHLVPVIGIIKRNALPHPLIKFGWYKPSPFLRIIGKWNRGGIFDNDFDYGVPQGIYILTLEDLNKNLIVSLSNVDWRARTDWILAESSETSVMVSAAGPLEILSPNDSNEALQQYISLAENHGGNYINEWGAGKEIVGRNNIGLLTFDFTDASKKINNTLSWRLASEDSSTPLALFPLSKFVIPMNFEGDRNHKDEEITMPTFNGL